MQTLKNLLNNNLVPNVVIWYFFNASKSLEKRKNERKVLDKVKGYNEMTDICYQNLAKGEIATIYGKLNNKIVINKIETKNIVHMDF